MGPRSSSLASVVAGGTANVAKLLVASLAFAGVYAGVEAYDAPVPAGAARGSGAPAVTQERTAARVWTVEQATEKSGKAETSPTRAPAEGRITVGALSGTRPCDRPYLLRSVVANPDPSETVLYGWHLQRWSPASRKWRPYLSRHSGFTGDRRTVEWTPHVVDNPGWYRATLSVPGRATVRGERFLISC